jgi:hypothetical protein
MRAQPLPPHPPHALLIGRRDVAGGTPAGPSTGCSQVGLLCLLASLPNASCQVTWTCCRRSAAPLQLVTALPTLLLNEAAFLPAAAGCRSRCGASAAAGAAPQAPTWPTPPRAAPGAGGQGRAGGRGEGLPLQPCGRWRFPKRLGATGLVLLRAGCKPRRPPPAACCCRLCAQFLPGCKRVVLAVQARRAEVVKRVQAGGWLVGMG